MNDLVPIPSPGDDIVPDGWWRSTVVPWADDQQSVDGIRQAAAQLAGLEAAYRTLNADTAELTKARRYLEHRWGVLLGPGERGTPGRSNPVATGLERWDRDVFRELAWRFRDGEPVKTTEIVLGILELRRDGDTLSRAKVLRAIREAIAEERRGEPVEDLTVDDVEIRHGDFREVLRDLCGTVDAIITDPPYEAAWVPMFDDLGELAANLLTSDGVLAVMTGHLYLPQYLDHLSTWLEYRWIGAYLTPGPRFGPMRPRSLQAGNPSCCSIAPARIGRPFWMTFSGLTPTIRIIIIGDSPSPEWLRSSIGSPDPVIWSSTRV